MSEKIITDYWKKPIPDRCFDWSAIREGYCGCGECHPPQGFGPDEASAVDDLLEQEYDAYLDKLNRDDEALDFPAWRERKLTEAA